MSGYYRRRARKGARAISVLHGQLGSGRVFGGLGRLASKTGGCRFDSCRACFSIACSSEVASGFPNAPAELLAQVAARLAGGRSLGLLEPAEGLAGGAPRAGARVPASCTTARDTAGKKVPDCRCGPCITAGNGAPSAPRARWARDPALCVDVGRVAAGRSSRSEEHTSELQSRLHLVCRLLLEKKNIEFEQ